MKNDLPVELLALAAAVLLTAPAGAFSDDAQIENLDAVQILQERGVLDGQPDGSFRPTRTVTQGEFAKMLARLLDPSAGYETSSGEHWAAPYLRYCQEQGILSGGEDPDQPLSGTDAAAMLLRAAGREDGLTAPAGPLSRDAAAALLVQSLPLFRQVQILQGPDNEVMPYGIAITAGGVVLVADGMYHSIWSVGDGQASLLAGAGVQENPVSGYGDGDSEKSLWDQPWGMAPFLGGWAVSDRNNHAIRLILDGNVQTVNGHSQEGLVHEESGVQWDLPSGLAAGEDGCLFVADTGSGAIRRISPDGVVTTIASGLDCPMGLAYADGVLYAAETGKNRILKIVGTEVSVLAGTGEDGDTDGVVTAASFSLPQGVFVDSDGTVLVADTGNAALRKIQNGVVETVPFPDNEGIDLVSPVGVAVWDQKLYVTDSFSRAIFVLDWYE